MALQAEKQNKLNYQSESLQIGLINRTMDNKISQPSFGKLHPILSNEYLVNIYRSDNERAMARERLIKQHHSTGENRMQ